MTLNIPILTPIIKRVKRKGSHKNFISLRTYEIHNKIVRELVSINVDTPIEVIKKLRKRKREKNKFLICKISEEDLHLLTETKSKMKLLKKYRRRLILLNT